MCDHLLPPPDRQQSLTQDPNSVSMIFILSSSILAMLSSLMLAITKEVCTVTHKYRIQNARETKEYTSSDTFCMYQLYSGCMTPST